MVDIPIQEDKIMLRMPFGANILDVIVVNNQPKLIAAVIPDNKKEFRDFVVIGVGEEVKKKAGFGMAYISSFVLSYEKETAYLLFEIFDEPISK